MVASDKEQKQKRFLIGLVLLTVILSLVGGAVLFVGEKNGHDPDTKRPLQTGVVEEQITPPKENVGKEITKSEINKTDHTQSVLTGHEGDGLGEKWDERLALAYSYVEGMKQKMTDTEELNDDSIARGLRSKAMAKLRESEYEAKSGDAVRARSALGEVLNSGEKFEKYLLARDEVLPSLQKFKAEKEAATDKGIHRFEDELFSQAVSARQEAEEATSNGDAELAIKKYDEGVGYLQKAGEQFAATIEDMRTKLVEAFGSGDKEASISLVSDILERIPADPEAEEYQTRVTVLDKTYPLYQAAVDNEKSGLYAIAEGQYREILKLDKKYEDVVIRLENIEETRSLHIADEKLEEVRQLLKQGKIAKALVLGEEAAQLNPTSKDAVELLELVKVQFEEQRLKDSLKKAMEYTTNGKLEAAEQIYLDLIISFPGDQEVTLGLEGVRTRMQERYTVETYLKAARKALNCGSVDCYEQGIDYVQEALNLLPGNTDAANLMAVLQENLRLMNLPVEVTFESDGKTRLEVHKIGIFKQISRETVRLKPGSYTVVAKRQGYRDVYMEFHIAPGAEQKTIQVVCKEKL